MLDRIRSDVEEALKPLEHGRAVVKKHLADKIALDFRHAHDLLCSIAVPVKPGLFPYNNWTPGTFDKDTAWYKVQMLLFKAGNAEAWPDRLILFPGFRMRYFRACASSLTMSHYQDFRSLRGTKQTPR